MTTPTGCSTCNKSSLALLLLRPSPIARLPAAVKAGEYDPISQLIPEGSEKIDSVATDIQSLLPARHPTESRIVLRTLRAGYVHIYMEAPSPKWIIYRVTEDGDLVPHDHAYFEKPTANFVCKLKAIHNAEGMKLVQIPQAHLTPTIWIAFSANLWTEKLRERNKKSPHQMQQVNLRDASPNTFAPTAENLRKRVLECGLPALTQDRDETHDFRFSAVKNVESLAAQLKTAASCHKDTKGRELAIVLRDHVGLASELSALRLRRHELMKKELHKPLYAHPLSSSAGLMALKTLVRQEAYAAAGRNLLRVMSFEAFKKFYPPGRTTAAWEPMQKGPKSTTLKGVPLGYVWTDDAKKQFEQQFKLLNQRNWSNIASEYDEAARQKWMEKLAIKMKALHLESIAKFENDWWAVCNGSIFGSYFVEQFDETDRNSNNWHCSPGLIYQREVQLSMTPQPMTDGVVLDAYVEHLLRDITQPMAMLSRAVAANQKEIIEKIDIFSKIRATNDHLHGERNDKLYDIGAGLVDVTSDSGSPNAPQRLVTRYSWLRHGLGDAWGAYSLSINDSVVAAGMAMAVRFGPTFFASAKGQEIMNRMRAYSLVQHTIDLAKDSVVSKTALRTTVVIRKRFPADTGMYLLGARGGFSNFQMRNAIADGFIELDLITDRVEMHGFSGDIDEAIQQGGGKVRLHGLPIPQLLQMPFPERSELFTDVQWTKAWNNRLSNNAAFWFQEGLRDGKAVTRSLEGKLALGAALLNGLQLVENASKWSASAPNSRARFDFLLGTIDAGASVLGAAAQIAEVAAKASIIGRLGPAASLNSVSIHGLRFAGIMFGTFAGFITAISQFRNAANADRLGHIGERNAYALSGLAFIGTGVTGALAAAGAYADYIVATRASSVAMRATAARFGARGTVALLGISVSGWGLIFLSAGIVFELAVVMLKRTEIQKWVQRTYFGYGKTEEKKFQTFLEEDKAFETLINPPKNKND